MEETPPFVVAAELRVRAVRIFNEGRGLVLFLGERDQDRSVLLSPTETRKFLGWLRRKFPEEADG